MSWYVLLSLLSPILMLRWPITNKPGFSNKISRKGMSGKAFVSSLGETVSLQGERGQIFAIRENSLRRGGVKRKMCYLEEIGVGGRRWQGRQEATVIWGFRLSAKNYNRCSWGRWVEGEQFKFQDFGILLRFLVLLILTPGREWRGWV